MKHVVSSSYPFPASRHSVAVVPISLVVLATVLVSSSSRSSVSGFVVSPSSSSSSSSFSYSVPNSKCEMTLSSLTTADPSPTFIGKQAKGVIFDVDGTLADSWKLGYDATVVVLRNYGLDRTVTVEEYHDYTRYCTPERLARHVAIDPTAKTAEEAASAAVENVEIQLDLAVGERLGKEFDDLYVGLVDADTAGFYDGIYDLLTTGIPRNVKVGALTNACAKYAHAVLKANCPVVQRRKSEGLEKEMKEKEEEKDANSAALDPVYDRFLSIRGADDVPKPKPNPDGLHVCCSDMGLSPEECIYVGDSPSDAMAAKNAGFLAAVGVTWGSHPLEILKEAPFDVLCHSVEELAMALPTALDADVKREEAATATIVTNALDA